MQMERWQDEKIINFRYCTYCSAFLASCSNKSQTATEENSTAVVSSSSSQETSSSSSAVSEAKKEETQIIGSNEYGFVKVPKSWVQFHEVEGGNDIQYSDGTDINIVTLNTFKAEQFNISEEEYAKLDVVTVSSSILTSKEQSSDFSKVWGSKSTIGGYEAYVVNAIAKSGKYLVTWVFRSNDGKIRYVSLEGDGETLKTILPMIESSWSTTKSE